jgi:hypothetical protein
VLAVGAAVPCAILLLPVFVIALAALAIVSCARTIGRILEPPYVAWREIIAFDRDLGWRPRASVDTHYFADRDDVFRVVTDAEGWPGRTSLDDSTMVVIGDSFAFGYGIDPRRNFAAVGGHRHIKAVAAPGYSMVHGVLLMEALGRRLNGKLVVWFVYLENDLQDNLAPEMTGYRAPFARFDATRGEWTIARDHLTASRWTCSNSDPRRLFPYLCVPGALADRAYAACDYLIARARAACDVAGAHLAIVTIPHPMQLSARGLATLAALSGNRERCDENLPDRRIAELCRKHDVTMVAGRDHLSAADYKRREGVHWNERGHRRMARVLERLYASFVSGGSKLVERRAARVGSGAGWLRDDALDRSAVSQEAGISHQANV